MARVVKPRGRIPNIKKSISKGKPPSLALRSKVISGVKYPATKLKREDKVFLRRMRNLMDVKRHHRLKAKRLGLGKGKK